MHMQYFPAELRALPQWCVASLLPDSTGKDDKRPYNPKTGNPASTTDPRTWGTFEEAIALRDYWRETSAPRAQVGFVFNENDPYAVIDLDTYKAKDEQAKNLHAEIKRQALTYAELSQSGLGTHIIGRGLVLEGARNEANAIEIYSHARFMICTGNVGEGNAILPVEPIQELLDYLYPLIKDASIANGISWRDLGDGEESLLTDLEIVERAMNAANSDKFLRLCQGDLSMHGGNWSDADEALIQFFCFYTPDNNQVARLFMRSDLAKRDKAERPDYVPRTIAYARKKLENDKPPPLDLTAIAERAKAMAAPIEQPHEIPSAIDQAAPALVVQTSPIEFPPGLLGEIARYSLAAAIRPVPEIALAAAIACMAGIVGRQYNISGTGLNQYILLLAKTGTGKESVQSSIDRLFAEVSKTVPAAQTFLGPSRFASGQALNKRFQKQPCFVSILGEFGDTLKRLSGNRASSADIALLSEMKDMYHKSGADQMLRSTVHSDSEKNTADVQSPALSLLGETAPEPFFASLDESLISSGFLPRFTVIEYSGERPARNPKPLAMPPAELVTAMGNLIAGALQMQQNRTVLVAQTSPEALAELDKFDAWVDGQIRGQGEVVRQLWNRAHIKALRLSALVAVGVNPLDVVVAHAHAVWAVELVKRDVSILLSRFQTGNVGEGDAKLQSDLREVITKYMTEGHKDWTDYHQQGCVTGVYLARQTASRAAFRNRQGGSNKALKDVLASMVEYGVLIQLEKKDSYNRFRSQAAVYALGEHWNK